MRRDVLFIIGILSILALPNSSSATATPSQDSSIVIDPMAITIVMHSNTTSRVHMRGLVNNSGNTAINSFTLRIDSINVDAAKVRVNDTFSEASVYEMDRYVNLVIPLDQFLEPNNTISFDASLVLHDLQTSSGLSASGDFEFQDFIHYVRPQSPYRNFTMTAILPEYATLSEQSVAPVFPRDSTNHTDGKSLIFTWTSDVIFPGQEQAYIISYQIPTSSVSQTGFLLTEIIVVGLLGIALGVVLSYSGPKIVKKFRELSSTRIVGITNEEKKVLEIIRAKGGSCPQKDLYTELDLSQAKVSIILGNLEERNLVRKFRDGRENMVHIIEE